MKKLKTNKATMMKSSITIITILAVVLVNSIQTFAQNTGGSKTHNEQVTIVSSFDPSINEAYKINLSPEDTKFDISKPDFSFEALNISLPTEIKISPITPVAINADKRTESFNNLLKLGVGSLFSPYTEFFHSSGSRGDYNFDAHIYQLSTFKNIKDYSPSPELRASADMAYKKFFRKHIFQSKIKYNLHSTRYYGFKPDDFPAFNISEDDLKQSFNLIEYEFDLKSNYRSNKKLSHSIKTSSYYLFDKYKTTELFTRLSFDLHKSFDVSDMLDYQNLGIKVNAEYFGNKDTVSSSTEFLIEATPYFTGKYGIVNFDIGLNFNYLNASRSGFYFYPILKANLTLIPDYLSVFAGISGNVEKNSFRVLSEHNPWVQSITDMKWYRYLDVNAGIIGNIGQKVNFSAQVSWRKFKNMYFFVNVSENWSPILAAPHNKFAAVYDDGSLLAGQIDITYSVANSVNILTGFAYTTYALDSLTSAYNRPNAIAKLGVEVYVSKKVKTWIEGYYYGSRTALESSFMPPVDINLEGFIDLNIGVEYGITEKLSVWLKGNNILNQQYQRFLNYPVYGIQIMGGISYRF